MGAGGCGGGPSWRVSTAHCGIASALGSHRDMFSVCLIGGESMSICSIRHQWCRQTPVASSVKTTLSSNTTLHQLTGIRKEKKKTCYSFSFFYMHSDLLSLRPGCVTRRWSSYTWQNIERPSTNIIKIVGYHQGGIVIDEVPLSRASPSADTPTCVSQVLLIAATQIILTKHLWIITMWHGDSSLKWGLFAYSFPESSWLNLPIFQKASGLSSNLYFQVQVQWCRR